jgi:hypothetical protein
MRADPAGPPAIAFLSTGTYQAPLVGT